MTPLTVVEQLLHISTWPGTCRYCAHPTCCHGVPLMLDVPTDTHLQTFPKPTLGVQPRVVIRPQSINFRGMPSGLVRSQRNISP